MFIYIHIYFVFTYTSFFVLSVIAFPRAHTENKPGSSGSTVAGRILWARRCLCSIMLSWHLWMEICLTSVNKGVTPWSSSHFHLAIPYHACVQRWTCCYNLPIFSQLEFFRVQWWVLWFPRCRHIFPSFSLQNSAHFQKPWRDAGMKKRNTQCLARGQKRHLPHNTSRSGELPQAELTCSRWRTPVNTPKQRGGWRGDDWYCIAVVLKV